MMGRILFFVLLGLLAVVFFKSWQRKQLGQSGRSKGQLPKTPSEETILQCRHCNSFAPLSCGVMIEGRFYCQTAHAKEAGERLA